MSQRIRKDDIVVVTTGKNRGAQGKVLKVLHEVDRVIVEGVNRVKRHQKPIEGIRPGGIIEKELSIHLSNVMPVDKKTGKGTRVRYQMDKSGNKKIRVTQRSNAVIEGA